MSGNDFSLPQPHPSNVHVPVRLLEALAEQPGVNVWIHRPSTMMREGEDAVNAAAAVDWMNALVDYMIKLRAVPAMKNLRGALDLVHLKNVGGQIILKRVFGNRITPERGGVEYVHEVGDVVIPLDRMVEFVREATGGEPVEVLAVWAWASRAVDAGLDSGIAAWIEGMDDPGQPDYPRMLRE